MKGVLILAAVGEGALGVALLIVPSLVGPLLLGEEFIGVAIPLARVTASPVRLGSRLWAACSGHVDLQRLSRCLVYVASLAGPGILLARQLLRAPDSTLGSCVRERQETA
jgi:hypothetical protein